MRRTLKIANSVRANETVGVVNCTKSPKDKEPTIPGKGEVGWKGMRKEHKAEIEGRDPGDETGWKRCWRFIIFVIANSLEFYLALKSSCLHLATRLIASTSLVLNTSDESRKEKCE